MCVSHAQAGFLKYFLIYWVLTDLSVCFSIQSSPHMCASMWMELPHHWQGRTALIGFGSASPLE